MTQYNTNHVPRYEVLQELGVLSRSGKWTKKVRLISWRGRDPRYDIRHWRMDDEGETPGKGITLTEDELRKLGELIREMNDE